MLKFLKRKFEKFQVQVFRKFIIKFYEIYMNLNRFRLKIVKIDGITYHLDLNELCDRNIYFLSYQDKYVHNSIIKLCKNGMVALDIGANIGAYTFIMAQLVGKKGQVIAFEPTSWAFSKLKKNMELNNFNNIILNRIALSNETKTEKRHFISSWLVKGGQNPFSKSDDIIQFITLDDYLLKNGILKVDFIKLDVDGFELKVLQGATKTLKECKPIIILETCIQSPNLRVEDIFYYLIDYGYVFYSIVNLKKINSFNKLINSIYNRSTLDVIASTEPLK
ncbi:hypothetical protein LCGC14_1758500 [marine sediment metagenome]|uniref:Methyltransferase FkbM domain-containing protein n=1 Tax=marine sediment metagenome TaxID=412755 RepID=A0A0F9HP20_9ZZZZ